VGLYLSGKDSALNPFGMTQGSVCVYSKEDILVLGQINTTYP